MAEAQGSVPSLKHRESPKSQSGDEDMEERALKYLERKGGTSVRELHQMLSSSYPSLTEAEVTDLVWRLAEEGKVDLEDVPLETKTIGEYVKLWERNLWLYVSLAISLATVLAVYVAPPELPFLAVRWVLGCVLVLFVPGYLTLKVLFPRGPEIDSFIRFALSVGLSLTLVSLVGLLLNYTPWGIRLDPIIVSLSALTVTLAVMGFAREYLLSVQRSGTPTGPTEP